MAETRYTEAEAILYAVREDEVGLREYLADPERFTANELAALGIAADLLASACRSAIRRRRRQR